MFAADVMPLSWRSNRTVFTFIVCFAALAICSIIERLLGSTVAILLILQLAVVIVALQCSAKFAYFSAAFEALSFNFLFTTPRYSLQMFHFGDMANLVVFIIVAFTTSQLADHYRRQQNELKQVQLRNSILLSVSHDLRTPLATIIGTLTTLKEYMGKLSDAEKAELLDSATSESHRLHRYIENLLQATKLQHGALKFNKAENSMVNVVHQAIARFPELASRIQFEVVPPLAPVFISNSLIEQAIFNVLDNALRFSPADHPVFVRAYQIGGDVIVDIKDEGVGVSKEQQEHIFELFYTNNPHKQTDGGAGLGLAVAKGIIMAHEGNIQVVPSNTGCLMRISLPASKEGSVDGL